MMKCDKCGTSFEGTLQNPQPGPTCLNCQIKHLTDQLDLARDEFQRIASCPGADNEIKGLCERGRKNINQHVSVIVQRDIAEARAAKLQRGLMTFVGCDTKQELITLRAACEAMPPDDNQRLSIVAIDTVLEAMQ